MGRMTETREWIYFLLFCMALIVLVLTAADGIPGDCNPRSWSC